MTGATVTVTLAAPAPGRYGIKMFHDVDGDGEMGTNIVGFPTEPFGFSNDAPIQLRTALVRRRRLRRRPASAPRKPSR